MEGCHPMSVFNAGMLGSRLSLSWPHERTARSIRRQMSTQPETTQSLACSHTRRASNRYPEHWDDCRGPLIAPRIRSGHGKGGDHVIPAKSMPFERHVFARPISVTSSVAARAQRNSRCVYLQEFVSFYRCSAVIHVRSESRRRHGSRLRSQSTAGPLAVIFPCVSLGKD